MQKEAWKHSSFSLFYSPGNIMSTSIILGKNQSRTYPAPGHNNALRRPKRQKGYMEIFHLTPSQIQKPLRQSRKILTISGISTI